MEVSVEHVAARHLGAQQRVIERTVCSTDAGHLRTVNAAYALYFPSDPPARSSICVSAWHGPFDVEINCIAIGTAPLPR
jgi:enamine deaminase RidA (YjgF/YER057c/UK114 family)